MPSSLKYKKIYVDSKFRSPGSTSSSDFKIELPETMTFAENTVFYLDDICIPHSRDRVIENINDKLYFKVYNRTPVPYEEFDIIATIAPGNYIGPDLATEIEAKMNARTRVVLNIGFDIFTCAYIPRTNKIEIAIVNEPPYDFAFRILTQFELNSPDLFWTGPDFSTTKPNDINEIISNLNNFSDQRTPQNAFMSGSIYLQPFNNIYINASNLGNYNTIGCQNERTIVKKVPVSADRGSQIFDQCVLMNDYNDCSGQTVKTLFFQLKSSRGDTIPLNGCNWSFSIVFSRNNPDL